MHASTHDPHDPHDPREPSVERLGGPGFVAAVRRHVLATRPPFFSASALPVIVGTAWAACIDHAFRPAWAALALAATVLAHAATNVYNDVADEDNGTDRANRERVYPYTGGSRFIQNGVLDRRAMARLAAGLAAGAVVAGAALAVLRGPVVLVPGLAGLLLGLAYSMPGVALAGRGAGEAAVGAGLGLLPVVGAAWLPTGRLDPGAWLIAVPVAAWVTQILLANEVPDREADRIAGKHTLAVRTGVGGVRALHGALTLCAVAAIVALVVRGELPRAALVIAAAALAAGARTVADLGADRARVRRGIETTLAVHALGQLALAGALFAA